VTGGFNHGGATTVNGGVLQVNSDSTIGGSVTVNQRGTLGGTGTINRNTEIAGTISPGNSVGQLNMGATLTLDPGGKYLFEYSAVTGLNPGVNYDTINNSALLNLVGFSPTTAPFTIVITPVGNPGTTGGPVTYNLGTFAGGVNGFDPNDFAFAGTFSGTPTVSLDPTNTILQLTFTPSAVPEPGSLALAGSAVLAAAGWWRSRRGRRAAV
jgi:hypothetical protein